MQIYIAPVQGHTDAAWRHFHQKVYGTDFLYFTPFIRNEHGEIRKKDMKDFSSELNDGLRLEPQVIFKDMAELELLLDNLSASGAGTINLNMGCPFPLQTGKGRGAAFLGKRGELEKLPAVLAKYPDIAFSVKMRLGLDNPDEWRGAIDILNELDLQNIYVHPRVARQQYGGELYFDRFEELLKESKNRVVFNGEIRTPDDATSIKGRFPEIGGIMLARGVLGRPSLGLEIATGSELKHESRIERMLEFHDVLFGHYSETLCGDAQILSKIKPFWEYAEDEIGHKAWKAIRKATSLPKYRTALSLIE